jgi:LPS sulfotransferase NodH
VATPLDLALCRREAREVGTDDGASDRPLLLVVAAPRTGSTLIYQCICQQLDVSYVDNATAAFPRSPISFASLARRPMRPPARVDNFYGNTRGTSGPNDAFDLWNRWQGEDRYRVDLELMERSIPDMRRFFSAWADAFPGPFVNKNNRHVSAIPELADALPSAVFLLVRRDPLPTAQSLLRARAMVQGSPAAAWGALGEDADDGADAAGPLRAVARQIAAIERHLDRAVEALPADQVIEARYEQFCADPTGLLQRIGEQIGTSFRADADPLPELNASMTVRLSQSDQTVVRNELN